MLKHSLYLVVGSIAEFELARQVIWCNNLSLSPALVLVTLFCGFTIYRIARAR